MMILWHGRACPFSQRVRIVLDEKAIQHEARELDPADPPPEVQALGPPCGWPILLDGGAVIPESLVVMQYLEERHPAPALWPAAPAGRAQVRLWLERAGWLVAASAILAKGGPERRGEGRARVRAALEALEAAAPPGAFLAGAFGLADAALAPFVALLPAPLRPDALGLPRLAGWWRRVRARPSVVRQIPGLGDGE